MKRTAKNAKKVFVGLSGGVDSAVSAALLQKEGYDVTGIFVRIVLPGYPCSAAEDRRSALRVAAHLRIPFIEVDLSDAYKKHVFEEMLAGYRRGETPNPDTLCNREIKFGLMYEYARAHGADFLATGHYARIAQESRIKNQELRGVRLLKGSDEDKDQSYFLWMVPQDALLHTMFPVGDMKKPQVRTLAKKFDLPNATRKDSQGICFLGRLSMEEMLAKELYPSEGSVLNEKGGVIGTHKGALLYTIGQRHGFSVPAHDPHTEPLSVIAKDVKANTITVAPAVNVGTTAANRIQKNTVATLRDTNWIGDVKNGSYKARFRYRQPLISAELVLKEGVATVTLSGVHHLPVGQSLVLYKGEQCVGGGVIQ